MFTTVNNVKEYTNADVTLDLIKRAQAIIEIFIGVNEIDVEQPSDFIILDKMTAYQSAYMLNNEEVVYSQAAVTTQGQTDAMINFDTRMMSPFIAPLAVFASRGLSWNRSKSFRTGRIFQQPNKIDWKSI
jgi:hypothetical protein